MRTLKFNDDDFSIATTGEVIIICMDELHSDFLRLCNAFQTSFASGNIPPLDITAKIMYCMIKGADRNLFKSYEEFMKANKKLSPFVDIENITAMMNEINDTFVSDEEEKEEAENQSKKKEQK